MSYAIEAHKINFAYDRQPVLIDVDLTVEEGDFVAFLGPNGGGKTTLIKILAGILKPDSGWVRILGRPVNEVQGAIGYVPQDLHTKAGFPISAFEVALMGRLGPNGRGRSFSAADKRAAAEALDRVGMLELRHELIGKLSGGQRQRVFIARALAGESRLLFLDEPVAGVDAAWQSNLFELLKELNRQVTIVVVSHDLSVMSTYIKSVACINRTLFHHPSSEISAQVIQETYQCPVELIAHGLPHRVLAVHDHPREGDHD